MVAPPPDSHSASVPNPGHPLHQLLPGLNPICISSSVTFSLIIISSIADDLFSVLKQKRRKTQTVVLDANMNKTKQITSIL